jgi:hypothetical protein
MEKLALVDDAKSRRKARRANGGGIGSGKFFNKMKNGIKFATEMAPMFLNEKPDNG